MAGHAGIRLVSAACTDNGRLRRANEDSHYVGRCTVAVADGLGGHNAGDVASAIATDTVREADAEGIEGPEEFGRVVQRANKRIHDTAAQDTSKHGMGTTLTAVTLLADQRIAVANVGDSRTSIYRWGDLIQVSRDHSIVQELVDSGEITPEQARVHPRSNVLTRALGLEPAVEVDVYVTAVHPGDRILLASDGLIDMVSADDIAEALWRHRDPQECARALVALANSGGGHDNITVIVSDVVTGGD